MLMAAGIAAGLCRPGSPGLNTSMMRRAEPQHGHGLRGVGCQSAPKRDPQSACKKDPLFPALDGLSR
jgi:hypothetical protein